jgi:hypothetical protein
MGGLICAVHRNAVLRFEQVPTKESQTKEFDKQIRELLNVTTIADSVVNETPHGQEVCDILAKNSFTHADRQKLLDIVEHLYEAAPPLS